jgi:hypothetical protein
MQSVAPPEYESQGVLQDADASSSWGGAIFTTAGGGVDVAMPLGRTPDGRHAGRLQIRESWGDRLSTPAALFYEVHTPGIEVIYNPQSGDLRQIQAPHVLVDIEGRVPNRGYYTIKFYAPDFWGELDDHGMWHPLDGGELVTYVVENPDRPEMINQRRSETLVMAEGGESWILPIDRFLDLDDDPNAPKSSGWIRYEGAGYEGADAWGRASEKSDPARITWKFAGTGSFGNEPPEHLELYRVEFFHPTAGGGNWQPIEAELPGAEGDEVFAYDPQIPWAGHEGRNHQYVGSEFKGGTPGEWTPTGPGPNAPATTAFDAKPDGVYMWLKRDASLFAKWDFDWPIDRAWSALRLTRVTTATTPDWQHSEQAVSNKRLWITKLVSGAVVEQTEYAFAFPHIWTLTVQDGAGNALYTEITTSQREMLTSTRTDYREVITPDDYPYEAVELYRETLAGDLLLNARRSQGGQTSEMELTWYDDESDPRFGRLRSRATPDGAWVMLDYHVFPDSSIRPLGTATEVRSLPGVPMPEIIQHDVGHAFVYTYASDIDLPGDDEAVNPLDPRKISEYIDGQEVTTTYNVFFMDDQFKVKIEERCIEPACAPSDPNSLQTITTTIPGSAGKGQPSPEDTELERIASVQYPDGHVEDHSDDPLMFLVENGEGGCEGCCEGEDCVSIDCDDSNPCMDDACVNEQCQHTNNTDPCGTCKVCDGGICISCETLGLCCDSNGECTDDCTTEFPGEGCCLEGHCIEKCPACTDCIGNQCVTCASQNKCCDQEGNCIDPEDCTGNQCLYSTPEACFCVPRCPYCQTCDDGNCVPCTEAGQCCVAGECEWPCFGSTCCKPDGKCGPRPDCTTCVNGTWVPCWKAGKCCDTSNECVDIGENCETCNDGKCEDCDPCEEPVNGICTSCADVGTGLCCESGVCKALCTSGCCSNGQCELLCPDCHGCDLSGNCVNDCDPEANECCVDGSCCEVTATGCVACSTIPEEKDNKIKLNFKPPSNQCDDPEHPCGITQPLGFLGDPDIKACRSGNSCEIQFRYSGKYDIASGICAEAFTNVIDGDDVPEADCCEIWAVFNNGSGCAKPENGTEIYGNHGCTAIHESAHVDQFREILEEALAALADNPALDPEPLDCGDNSCADVLNDRRNAIVQAILAAGTAARNKWIDEIENNYDELEYEAREAAIFCYVAVAEAMCVEPTNCGMCCSEE